jgi:hypothetical protein
VNNCNKSTNLDMENDITCPCPHLRQLRNEIDELKEKKKNGIKEISTSFDYLREEIDIATESLIEIIREKSSDLLNKVDEIEKEYIDKFSNDQEMSNNFDHKIEEYERYYQSLTTKKTEKRSVQEILKKLSSDKKRLKCNIFNKNFVNFKINENELTTSIIGTIEYEYLNCSTFNDYQKINVTDSIRSKSKYSKGEMEIASLDYLKNQEKFIIAYSCVVWNDVEENSLASFNSNFKKLIKNIDANFVTERLITCSNDNKIIMYPFKKGLHHTLTIINSDLNIERQKQIKINPLSMCATNDKVFILLEQHDTRKLSICNMQLQVIEQYGQSDDPAIPFFMNQELQQILFIQTGYFVLRYIDKLDIITEKNGQVEEVAIDINRNNMILNSKNKIIYFNKKQLIYLNELGETVNMHILKNFPDLEYKVQLFEDKEEKLMIYDSIRHILHKIK